MVIIRPLICLVQTDDCSNSDACCCNEKPRSLNGDTGTICFMEIKFWPRLSHQVTAFHQVLNVMFFNAFFFCYMTFKALWECRKTDSSADFKFSFICLEQCIQVSWPERLPLELVHWSATVCSVDQWFSLFLFLCQSGPSCELWNTDLVQISSGEEGELETWGLLALFLL